jgi:hypothetical protein
MNGGGKLVERDVELLMSQTFIVIGFPSLSFIDVIFNIKVLLT